MKEATINIKRLGILVRGLYSYHDQMRSWNQVKLVFIHSQHQEQSIIMRHANKSIRSIKTICIKNWLDSNKLLTFKETNETLGQRALKDFK